MGKRWGKGGIIEVIGCCPLAPIHLAATASLPPGKGGGGQGGGGGMGNIWGKGDDIEGT